VTAYGGGSVGGSIASFGGAGIVATGGNAGLGTVGGLGGDGVDAFGGKGTSDYGGDGIYAEGGFPGGGHLPTPGYTSENYAGHFNGDVNIVGNLSKAGGSFQIDHPLDPVNKYLYHSFAESPDMMNIYNGKVVTDGSGTAIVTMPAWFEALNKTSKVWGEGFLASDRYPAGRLGHRASHPSGSGQSAAGPRPLHPSRAVRTRGRAEHSADASSPATCPSAPAPAQ